MTTMGYFDFNRPLQHQSVQIHTQNEGALFLMRVQLDSQAFSFFLKNSKRKLDYNQKITFAERS